MFAYPFYFTIKTEGGDVMYNNPYYNSAQSSMDRIDGQIRDLENMRNQLQRTIGQQPSINQTFQLTPNSSGVRLVGSVEDVNKELVFADSVFISRDFSSMWIKNTKGEVRHFDIKETVEKDEKDLLIDELKARIDKLERGERDEEPRASDTTTEPIQE